MNAMRGEETKDEKVYPRATHYSKGVRRNYHYRVKMVGEGVGNPPALCQPLNTRRLLLMERASDQLMQHFVLTQRVHTCQTCITEHQVLLRLRDERKKQARMIM